MVRVRVLGPIQLVSDGRVVRLPGPRETELLALLVARYPRAASITELLEDLWGTAPPAGAESTLRSYVSTLRRALRAYGLEHIVVTAPGSYAISAEVGETLDARLFEVLLRHAGRSGGAGELRAQIQTLEAALGLWRGAAFSEVTSAPGVAARATYLDEARVSATEQWAEARLASGGHVQLAAELAALCQEYPLRERLWELRMVALYRAGRQAEALASYRRLQRTLSQQLGIEPGARLRALELAILRQDPALDPPITRASGPVPEKQQLPRELHAVRASSFVGRGDELDALEVAWTLALDGTANPVLIAGEAGIGKTTLASAFAERLGLRGTRILAGRCKSDAAAPYRAFHDAIAPLLAEQRPAQTAPADLGHWARAQGITRSVVAGGTHDLETARRRMFEAVGDLILSAAQDTPLLLVIEDLHWADDSSLQLLRHLTRTARTARALIVGTYRDSEVAPGSPLEQTIAELQREPGATTLKLRGLSESEVVAVIASNPSQPGDPEASALASLLHRATDGNPLYLRQMLAHLARSPEAFVTSSGALRQRPPLPAGIHDAINRRLTLLSPETRSTLTLAAVIGADFELDLLEEAHGSDVVVALEEGQRAGLILEQPGERFRFAHELVRHTLTEQLSHACRARVHERVAEALEGLAAEQPSCVPALAEHFAAAARPGHTSKAVSYAQQAGRQALQQFAFVEAAACAQRGLDCLRMERAPDLDVRCELLLLLAEARLHARDIQGCKHAAADAADDARSRHDSSQLARAAIVSSHLNVFGQTSEPTRRTCQDALQAIADGDPIASSQILAGLADYTAASEGDAPRAEALSKRALTLAHECESPEALARALFVHAEVLGWRPSIRERLALAEELLELAAEHDDPRTRANGHHVRAIARLEAGDVRGFDADLTSIDQIRAQIDYWYIDMFALLWRGMRALMHGAYDEVERWASQLLAHARHEPNVVNLYAGQLSWARREQGRLGELRPLVQDAIRHSPEVTGFHCGLALIHADHGELDQASEQLDQLAANDFAALPRDATWTTSLTILAEVAAAVGDRRRARTLFDLLVAYRGTLIVTTKGMVCAGAADRYLGLLAATNGEAETADRYFQSALALETEIDAPALIERTRNCYRRALLA